MIQSNIEPNECTCWCCGSREGKFVALTGCGGDAVYIGVGCGCALALSVEWEHAVEKSGLDISDIRDNP